MKITSIKQQAKNSERASFFVDGKYTFSLSLNELVAEKLKINQEISGLVLKRLMKLSIDGKLKDRSLEWTISRPRSVREFKDYLYRKKAEPEQIETITESFLERGYLNDTKFALWLIEMRRRGGKSDRAIQNELMKKGIAREEITNSLQKNSIDERLRLKILIDKKLKQSRYKTDEVKLKQLLVRRGFSYEDIKAVFQKK
jgi:regulatory protein